MNDQIETDMRKHFEPDGSPRRIEAGQLSELAAVAGSVLWVTAIVLTRRGYGETTISQTVSWKNGCTEDEARGAAVKYALEAKPGFSVDMVTTAKIEIPPQNVKADS